MSDLKQRIARIRATVDLPSIFLQYGIKLKQRGEEYSACCPWHDDSNPSLSIFDADNHQRYFCHACGASGDVVDAYMHFSGQDTMPALDDLDGGDLKNPKPFATISSEPKPTKPERTVTVPPPDAGEPPWDRAVYRCGDEWLSLGQPVATWCYRTSDGAPWYYEARYEVTDEETGEVRKEPRCWTWGNRGAMPARWECAHHPVPRPLFGLEQLSDADQVLIGEGPKKASAARQMLNGTKSVACVGWAGGANGVRKSDWSALEGKALLLMPDADEPGRAAMDVIATIMRDKVPSIHIIDTSDMPHAWDAADALADGMTKAEFIAFLKERKREWVASEAEPEIEPEPETESYDPPSIPPEPPPTEDYKYMGHDGAINFGEPHNIFSTFSAPKLNPDVLPRTIREFVIAQTEAINTDPAYLALSCLTMAAGVIDDRIKIEVKPGWRESARIWAMLVGEVSSKKSPAMNKAKEAIDQLVEKVAPMDAENQKIAIRAQKIYDAKIKEFEAELIKTGSASGAEPAPPQTVERLKPMVKKMTLEHLEEVLRYQPRGIYAHFDELSGWLGSMDAYRPNGVNKDRPAWLELFNGGTMQCGTIGRGEFTIQNWSACVLGSIQPSKIGRLAESMSDDGLLQRFLIVCSDYVAGKGGSRNAYPETQAWSQLVDQLYFISPGESIKLSEGAKNILSDAHDKIYEYIDSGFLPGPFQGFLGKLEGYAARLILTWHCVECAESKTHPSASEVSDDTASRAIAYLMEHLVPHAAVFYDSGVARSDVADCARSIAGLIVAEKIEHLSTTYIQKSGPPAFRYDKTPSHNFRRAVMARLIDMDWLKPSSVPSSVSRMPTQYIVNPSVHSMFQRQRDDEIRQAETRREIGARIRSGAHGDYSA